MRLIFFTSLGPDEIEALISDEEVIATLRAYGATLAITLPSPSPGWATLLRTLSNCGIDTIVWLQPEQPGTWLSQYTYPQAITAYRHFRAWAIAEELTLSGVGLDMRPPMSELRDLYDAGLVSALRRLWQAREDALYPAAEAAYRDLVAEIRLDGYEVHIFKLPMVLDDQRAGTTVIQRVLNVVDVPADAEVLLCYSALPFHPHLIDMGGALITAYSSDADLIAVGAVDAGDGIPRLPWLLLRRDLLLAAQYTDTIYIFSLEACAAAGHLPPLRTLDWQTPARAAIRRHALLLTLRTLILSWLLLVRFGPLLVGWSGWLVAALLLIQRWRQARRRSR